MRPLFRLDKTVKRDLSVTRWFDGHPEPLRTLAQRWYKALRSCGDDVREVLHDDQPTVCVDGAAFAYINVFKAHVNVGFFHGAELPDPEGLLEGSGKFMRHVKVKPGVESKDAALRNLIRIAYADVKERLTTE